MDNSSILYDVAKGFSAQLARQMIDDGTVEEVMPHQESYRKEYRKHLSQLLFNLTKAQSLSRMSGKRIKVAIPLTQIQNGKGRCGAAHMSYSRIRKLLDAFKKENLIVEEKGKPFWECSAEWVFEHLDDQTGSPKGKVTRIYPVGKLEERINAYLDGNTAIGADVDILVEESAVVLEEDGEFIRTFDSPEASHFQRTVEDVNEAVAGRLSTDGVGTSLSLPLSLLFPSSHSITDRTSPEQAHEVVTHEHCPTAWAWEHELDGDRITYTVPESALKYQRKFCRGSWDCGGRFYSDFLNVPSDWRKHMRIGGEPVTELDYDNLHFNMLYAEEGETLGRDAYQTDFDMLEGLQRPVNKIVANVLINAPTSQALYGCLKNSVDWQEEVGLDLPDEIFQPIVESLRKRHEPISDHFHSDAGIRLQRKDSDLACEVMTETGAIGIHDGFVIEASREGELRDAMKRAFAEEYGSYDIGVSREFEPLTPDGDFALDRTSPAESGADRKRRASPKPS
ncbi:hypothetical protein GGP65_002115 [Salinibacter ruber]|uniref:hypothetical protein n=1 Tax=Salinibacter ruber TaxID=146919 RepID=UPI0021698503|nr:hypothetical protein [Salinibacter ruber]MCS3664489.1 hypothetical protein [Salinibacter ruber]